MCAWSFIVNFCSSSGKIYAIFFDSVALTGPHFESRSRHPSEPTGSDVSFLARVQQKIDPLLGPMGRTTNNSITYGLTFLVCRF